MRLFACEACGNPVYFDNSACTACGAALGFVADETRMAALDAAGTLARGGPGGPRTYRQCAHYVQREGCNWLVAGADADPFCVSCRLNRTIPDLGNERHRELWHRLEAEKRRLVYSALRLGLPITPKSADPALGLAFDFLADPDPQFSERGRVLTGHAAGLITINIAEADPAERERMREQMDEPYRTLLGHFRHESGHYYWDRLVAGTEWLEPFRALFGDERQDYGAALERHYAAGPPAGWPARFVSAYAASHPWEDWAESWSHYLHMVDALETAWHLGFRTDPRLANADMLDSAPDFDPYLPASFDQLIGQWLPFTVALNSLNESMGQEPAYPFALASPTIDKLRFVHQIVWAPRVPMPQPLEQGASHG